MLPFVLPLIFAQAIPIPVMPPPPGSRPSPGVVTPKPAIAPSPEPQTITVSQPVRPLPGKLDTIPVFNSNNLNITLQPQFELQPKFTKNGKNIRPINYVADFEVEYADGRIEVLDAKGMAMSDSKIKRKLFDYVYPDKILRWVAISIIDGGLCDIETIEKGRKERKKAK